MVEDARTSQTLDTKLKKAITFYWKMKNLLGKAIMDNTKEKEILLYLDELRVRFVGWRILLS